MVDQSKIGVLAAELMERIEGEVGPNAEIGDVVLIVEVLTPPQGSAIFAQGTNPRIHTVVGLLEMARRLVTGN